jgi:ATP-dependent Clp protease protease subunit
MVDKVSNTPAPIRCFEGTAQPHEPFWRFVDTAAGEEAEMELDGVISEYSWFDDDITPKQFKKDLYDHGQGGPITIKINSPGGDVVAASMIHTMIKEYPGKVTVQIQALAASAATMVAVAADTIKIQEMGYFMIHDPAFILMFAYLNIEEMTRMTSCLQAIKDGIINAYETRTGLSRARLSKLMTDETWMDAQRAMDLGFVDEIIRKEDKQIQLPESLPNNAAAVNVLRNFKNVPTPVSLAYTPMNVPPEPVSSEPVLTGDMRREAQTLRERVDSILKKEKNHA